MKNEVGFKNINEINFHPVLKDIENIFWLFILSHKVLANLNVQNIIKTTEDSFIVSMLEKYNQWVNLQIKINNDNTYITNSNILDNMIFTGKAVTILTYEFLIASKYKEIINGDEEFHFLKYIRNSAAHDNKFDLKYRFGKNKGDWMINKNDIIKWNGMEISRKLQDTKVFNNFISIFGVFLLAKHFSERLTNIDSGQK